MTQNDWTTFTKKIKINSTIENVYKHWVIPELLCIWFLKDVSIKHKNGHIKNTSEKVEVGDKYTWRWHNYDGEENGTIINANEKDTLEFTFANETTKVKVTLTETTDQVLVELTQYNIATDDNTKFNIFYGCSNGWTFWLANLKAYLEHGILLHETELGNLDDKSSCGEYVNV